MAPTGGKLARMAVVAVLLLGGAVSYVVAGLHLFDGYHLAYGNYQGVPRRACSLGSIRINPASLSCAIAAHTRKPCG